MPDWSSPPRGIVIPNLERATEIAFWAGPGSLPAEAKPTMKARDAATSAVANRTR